MPNKEIQPRKRGFKAYLLIAVGVLAVGLTGAHFAWKYSGSDQPELLIDRNGIKVYGIKSRGTTLLQMMAVRQVDTTLDRAVASMLDSSLENCADWSNNCVVSRLLEPWNPQTRSYVQLWTKNLPSPFSPREFILQLKFDQDPKSRATTVQFSALPDKLPPDDCCFRLSHMQSRWVFTPIDEEKLDVELLMDVDVGIPYPMFNRKAAENVYSTFEDLPRIFNQARYDVKVDWLLSASTASSAPSAPSAPSAE